MGFFDEETDSTPYESLNDWYEDIRHLYVPTVLLFFLTLFVLITGQVYNIKSNSLC